MAGSVMPTDDTPRSLQTLAIQLTMSSYSDKQSLVITNGFVVGSPVAAETDQAVTRPVAR